MKITKQNSQKLRRWHSAGLFAAALAFGMFLAGCVVTSVYPFYTAKDVVMDPALVGLWSEHGSAEDTQEHWRFERLGDKAYLLTTTDQEKTNRFETHLFRLERQTFLDFCLTNRVEGQLPLHYLLKVVQIEPSFQFQLLDYGWLGKLLEAKPETLRHIIVPEEPDDNGKGQLVLTADTKELQKFILKYSGDTNAFDKISEMKRRKD